MAYTAKIKVEYRQQIAPRKDENVHLDILKGLKINKCIKYSLFRMYP